MTATEYVILVDENDQEIGVAEKLAAHQQGLLHRAFSVFIFKNPENPQLLLQQRALGKYHSPGLWTNTCCSHPRQGESVIAAANRRLMEEMGITAPLNTKGTFQYKAHFDNGLCEHELDHVLVGFVEDGIVLKPNPQEIHSTQWMAISELKRQLKTHPEQFTPWLEKALALISEA
jgi:isopentenyl-diphosphate delta-isomerase